MLEPLTRSSPEIYAEAPTPQNLQERLELANRLYQEYRVQCFWHSPHDLDITRRPVSNAKRHSRYSRPRAGQFRMIYPFLRGEQSRKPAFFMHACRDPVDSNGPGGSPLAS